MSTDDAVPPQKEIPKDSKFEEGDIRYFPGGFHPVRLGQVYNSKYEVLRKLGYGRYSTVWLVKNQESRKLWAMKVLSAECYGASLDIFELEIMQHLTASNPEHEGYQHISTLQDSFRHEGPNGTHVCLIMKLMGESLSTFTDWFENRTLSSPLVQLYTYQLMQALAYAHSCGVIHTDIQPSNIMMQILDESLIEKWLEISEPATNPDSQNPRSPVIATQSLREFYFPDDENYNLGQIPVALVDWGVASWVDKHLTKYIQPVLLRSPEVILEMPWSATVDIWNLGALVPELIYAQRTFSGVSPDRKYTTEQHLEEIATLLGPFPKTLLDLGNQELVKGVFDDEGKILKPRLTLSVGLEVRFSNMPKDERNKFVKFIRALMTIDPNKRESAKALLAHDWFQHEYV